MGRPLRPQEKDILTSPLIIFVMGGPGCGKGTQCKNMATKYGFCHVGLGQLLRQEAQQGTRRGQKIRDIMLQGLLVPTGVILDMISDHMLSCPESRGFLIDGFPRELRQAKEFERIVGRAPNLVIVFDCSMETMVQRALRQGQVERQADDCEVAIYQRLETHYTLCEPILTFYQQKNLLQNILAEAAPENIFAKCCSVIERLKGRSLTNLEGHGGREQPHLDVAAVAAPATHTCGPSHLGSERDTRFFGAGIQP